MKTLVVYSRRGCHLCEELLEELQPLVRGRANIDVRDIDSREEWRASYDTRVPVVACGDRDVCEARLDAAAIEAILSR